MQRLTYKERKRRREMRARVAVCVTALIFVLLFVWVAVKVSSLSYKERIASMQEEHDAALGEFEKKLAEANERNPEYITVLVESEALGPGVFKHIQLNVDVVKQQPELPAGCEATSLTACLNYFGFEVDKLTIARLMPQGPIGRTDPDVAFIGNPEKKGSYGCNAPVVVTTANMYLESANTDIRAYDLTGHNFEDLLPYVEKGYPIMIWGLEYMQPSDRSTTWNIDGKEITWPHGFHCLVLVGWNDDGYIIMDPILGMKVYPRKNVHDCYESLGKQAVVIQPNNAKKE